MQDDFHTNIAANSNEDLSLSDEYISDIAQALNGGDEQVAKKIFQEELGPIDTAEFLSKIARDDRASYLRKYSKYINIETYSHLNEQILEDIVSELTPSDIAYIIRDLESDDALDIISMVSEDQQKEVIKKLSKKTRLVLEEGLSFPEDSAGRLMQRDFVSVPQFWTAGKTIDYIRTAREELPEDFFDIIIVDPTYHVLGEVPLNNLIRADRKESVESLMLETPHPIPVDMDQEDVARIFQREDLSSAPVVDKDGRLIGVIMVDDVIDVIHEEAKEDILKMGGVGQDDLYEAVLSTIRSRFGWLFINLLTAISASIVISFFEGTIQQIVALAVLMPIVASMGGNAGTQALTVAVRAIATNEISSTNAIRVIWKESLVGLLNGLAFALITGSITAIWFEDVTLGVVIGCAMIINLVTAGLFGSMIPIILDKTGQDPALASTVVLTTLTDVIGFLAFLGLAAAFIL